MKQLPIIVGALAVVLAGLAAAQQTNTLDQRQARQQQHINQGTASGQLTAKEASRLQQREAKLANDEAAAKADGVVTRAERRKLHREANHNSHAIRRQKHDRQTSGTP